MRNDFTGPGKYEGLTPFHGWLCENVDQLASETSGDVESSTGWFALITRPHVEPLRRKAHVVSCDSAGFWYVDTFLGPNAETFAGAHFDSLDADYCAANITDDDFS